MSKRLLVVALLCAPSLAVAQRAVAKGSLSTLEPSVVSEKCAELASFAAPTFALQLEARVSVASCVASQRLDAVPRMAPALATAALSDAAEPAIAMLDEVIAKAGTRMPGVEIIAQTAKANIYTGLVVRARTMIPPMLNATGTKLALLMQQHADLEQQLAPWIDREEAAFSAVASIGRMHPELNRDPVIQTAIRESNQALEATPLSATR